VGSDASQLLDAVGMRKLMAGFEDKKPGPPRTGVGRGKFRRVADIKELPVGDGHAVYDGESVALCGATIVITHGEWAEKRGVNLRDHPRCAELAAEEAE
jgi:hypothetical protein